MTPYQEEGLVSNVLWIFANFLGEKKLDRPDLILRKTNLIDFLSNLISYNSLTPMLIRILPWLCANLIRKHTLP